GAATGAGAAVVARRASVVRLGQDGDAPDGDATLGKGGFDFSFEVFLGGVHLHRLEELAVGQVRQALGLSRDADEALHVIVPRRDVGVADGTVYAVTVAQVGLEVEVAPAVHLPPPDQRAPANPTAANPRKRRVFDIRILGVVEKKVLRRLVELPRSALDMKVAQCFFFRYFSASIRKLPGLLVLGDIIGTVRERSAAVEHERLQPFLAEFFRRPAPGDPGADDDGVIFFALLVIHLLVYQVYQVTSLSGRQGFLGCQLSAFTLTILDS